MPTSIATIQINAPLADVYRYIATPHLLSEWVEGLRSGVRIAGDSGELKVGMRSKDHRQITGTLPDADPEVVGFAPDESVALRLESAGFIMHTRFHLFESEGVTTVRQSVQLGYTRWFKLFRKITGRTVQRRIDENLRRLKDRIELGETERSAA